MHGDFVYIEFSLNPKAILETLNFYETLFKWSFKESFLSSKKYFMFETPSKTFFGGFDENTTSSPSGVLIYLECSNIDGMLDIIEKNYPKVSIIKRKTLISEDYGSFAIIIDPSGNRIGLQESKKT
jgi:predicted enzyme related to lactoylglutathione lyase